MDDLQIKLAAVEFESSMNKTQGLMFRAKEECLSRTTNYNIVLKNLRASYQSLAKTIEVLKKLMKLKGEF